MVPLTEFFTGQEKTSPSGMFRVPSQGLAPMPLMLNRRSVPGDLRCTWSAFCIRRVSGSMALAILR